MAKLKPKSKLQKKLDDPSSRLWRNKADWAWRKLVFHYAQGKCIICGSTEFVQAHHMIPREILTSRHRLENGVMVCAKHHKYNYILSAHKNPVRFYLWLMRNQPERWRWLSTEFDPVNGIELPDGHNINFKEIYTQLMERLNQVTTIQT